MSCWDDLEERGLELFELPGVYALQCKETGESYVGMTTRSVKQRIEEHLRALIEGRHSCKRLQSRFWDYGPERFSAYVIQASFEKAELQRLEIAAMAWLLRLGYLLNTPTGRVYDQARAEGWTDPA